MEKVRLIEDETSNADIIRQKLNERVIGQEAAIDSIVGAFDKAYLRDERRPVAALMFLGPTGVGKTEVAESLADILSVDKLHPSIIRIDCAQYAHGYEVSALVGAPPSYVGRDQKPLLDPEIIEQPGSVLLLDEIEKGHPRLWNYLLQMMEGRGVTLLNSGQTVNFSNCVIIMTSNVGAGEMDKVAHDKRIGFGSGEKRNSTEAVALNALRKQFAPEFLNRLDAMVTFNQLTDEQLCEVLQAHVTRSNINYERRANIQLRLSDELKTHIVETAELRKEFNARPVIRNYEKLVVERLSKMITKGQVGGNVIHAELEDGKVVFDQGEAMPTIEDLITEEDFERMMSEPFCEDDEKEKS